MYNIGVIYGSRTCEHDVSIISALQAAQALDKQEIQRHLHLHRPRGHLVYRAKRLRISSFMSASTPPKSRA